MTPTSDQVAAEIRRQIGKCQSINGAPTGVYQEGCPVRVASGPGHCGGPGC